MYIIFISMNYPGHMAEYRACSKRIQCFGSGLYNTNEIGEEFMEALIIEAVDAADKAGFEKYGIERAAWTYKKMDFGLIDERYSSRRNEIILYCFASISPLTNNIFFFRCHPIRII